ncbi:MAG TPA: hypothetical protein ENK88_05745 [Campylobacterales bacterium]|nr:hypothetical protein [Campylobacterales bacterium]
MIFLYRRIFFIVLSLFVIQGCLSQPKFTKEEINITKPMVNNTYFSDAFEKLNRLLFISKQSVYKFQVKNIENKSSNKGVPEDIRNFILTPLILHMHNMKIIAHTPIYNIREAQVAGVKYFPKMAKMLPEIVIDGAITQFDKDIISTDSNFDTDADFGKGEGQTNIRINHDSGDGITTIALDLNAFTYEDRAYISGVATHNKIEIHRIRKSNRAGFFVNGSGIGYSKYTTLQQSQDEALRILSEYSLLQLIGRLYNIPYWKSTTPNLEVDELIMQRKENLFNNAKMIDKIKLIEDMIPQYGYSAKKDGNITKEELKALSTIQKEYNFKTKMTLTSDFYKELYISAPIFPKAIKENRKKISKARAKKTI